MLIARINSKPVFSSKENKTLGATGICMLFLKHVNTHTHTYLHRALNICLPTKTVGDILETNVAHDPHTHACPTLSCTFTKCRETGAMHG